MEAGASGVGGLAELALGRPDALGEVGVADDVAEVVLGLEHAGAGPVQAHVARLVHARFSGASTRFLTSGLEPGRPLAEAGSGTVGAGKECSYGDLGPGRA
jgi:hypothetical protein